MTTDDATWRDLLIGGADLTDADCDALDRLVATPGGKALLGMLA